MKKKKEAPARAIKKQDLNERMYKTEAGSSMAHGSTSLRI